MIVVSHRGPYRFEANGDGSFTSERGAGGVASALGAVLEKSDSDATWIAAALSDDDRAAAESGSLDDLDIDLRLVALDPELHTMHYDVVSNGVLWFLFHDLFDRVRRPRFDDRFREAWDAYRDGQRRVRRGDRRGRGPRATSCSCNDYQLSLTGAQSARAPPRPAHRALHAHAVLRTRRHPRAPRLRGRGPVRRAGAQSRPASTPRAGRTRTTSRHATCSAAARRSRRRSPRASAPTSPRSTRSPAATKPTPRPIALDDVVGDRLVIARSDRIEPSKNIVRGFLAYDRLLEARPGLRGRVVFVAMLYPSRQTLPEYLAYANEIEQVVARVNDRWATRDWTPILLDERDDFPRSIAAMQRYDVLLVNPIKDGLNLVAKEGPAVNRRDGLLCLSPRSRRVRGAARRRDPGASLRPRRRGGGTRSRAGNAARRTRRRSRRSCATLATARTPADWIADLVAHAS